MPSADGGEVLAGLRHVNSALLGDRNNLQAYNEQDVADCVPSAPA